MPGSTYYFSVHCDLIPLQIFFHFDINQVLPILHTKFQPNIPSLSGDNADLLILLLLVSAAILNSRPD